jgi:hypothetical protein
MATDRYQLYKVEFSYRIHANLISKIVVHRGARNLPEMQRLATEEAERLGNPKPEAGTTADYDKANTPRDYGVLNISEVTVPGFKINLERLAEGEEDREAQEPFEPDASM